MVSSVVWHVVLVASIVGIVYMIPATIGAYMDVMREDTPAHLPRPYAAMKKPGLSPRARLTGREYRRILRETAAYKKMGRATVSRRRDLRP